jgi:DNA-binding transcriptional ArsR family regulator
VAALDSTFAALADPTRKAVVGLLSRGPRRAGDLADSLDQTPAAMSRHLRVLRRSGLIAPQGLDEDARVRLYHLRREPFDEMREWLAEMEAFWCEQLDAFRDHVARQSKATPAVTQGKAARKKKH